MEPRDYFVCLDELSSRFSQGNAIASLRYYLENYRRLAGKSRLEWRLLSMLTDDDCRNLGHVVWPDDALLRPSGIGLAFVASQLASSDLQRPLQLATSPPISHSAKLRIARAWALHPDAQFLDDAAFRRSFALRLADHPDAVGYCALAAAASGDSPLASELGAAWLRSGLTSADAPEVARQAAKQPLLRAAAKAAVDICLWYFRDDPGAVCTLAEAASSLAMYPEVCRAAAALTDCALSEKQKGLLCAMRLVALVETGNDRQAVDEYRRDWKDTQWVFPYPTELLYSVQQAGAQDVERDLLMRCRIDDSTPEWVRLTKESILGGRQASELLAAWDEYFNRVWSQGERDRRILVGATEALLRANALQRQDHREFERQLRGIWTVLANDTGLRTLAWSFIVRLAASAADCIRDFEAHLLEASPEEFHVRQAARAYIFALRSNHEWPRLGALDRRWLERCCSFEEREFLRLMARADAHFRSSTAAREQLAIWEDMLRLPLGPREVAELAGRFTRLYQSTAADWSSGSGDSVDDIRLQILRRVKAEAQFLAGKLPAAELGYSLRLQNVGMVEAQEILEDLTRRTQWDPKY
jgi:hypothetical protein